MKVDKKWLGGLMFGAVLFAAAGNSSYAGYESGNMWESLSDVFSQYGIVSYAAETSSVDLNQIKKVEYGNLRELIKAGNFSYLQSEDSQNRRSEPYEKMHETLKEEYDYLKKMADSYKDDGDTEMQALYENNAKNIRISMAQVQSTINRMNSASQEKTMEDMTDALTASAQNLMNSYNQMAANVAAMEKSVEAAQSSYDAAVKKRSAGLIKDTEPESEKSSLTRQQNSLASLKEQQSELKESLLTMLGLSGRTDIEIGTVPDPNLSAIRAVSVENDLQTAISNDPTWVSEMKSKVTGTDNRELRKQRISEAAQSAEISLRSAYENLQNALSQYEAAESAYSAAKQAWDTVQKKQAAGMLSKNAYLSGQASWLSGEAAMNTAKLNLVSAYTSYVWQVAGVETGTSGGTAAAAGSSGGGAPAGR